MSKIPLVVWYRQCKGHFAFNWRAIFSYARRAPAPGGRLAIFALTTRLAWSIVTGYGSSDGEEKRA
jgi:hypothetical protein